MQKSTGFESLKTLSQSDFYKNQIIETAATLQNCWISFDEEGEEYFLSVNDVLLRDILPLASKLAGFVIEYLPNTTIYNVATFLIKEIESKPCHERSYRIKSATQQLADMAIKGDVQYPQETNLPF